MYNRDKYNKSARLYRSENKEKYIEHDKKIMVTWEGLIPKFTQCQMCGKDVVFNGLDKSKSIFFDHRNGGEECIKGSPSSWLKRHRRTPKNEAIWKSCDFGILCHRCNIVLPTENRKLFLSNATKYINAVKDRKDVK